MKKDIVFKKRTIETGLRGLAFYSMYKDQLTDIQNSEEWFHNDTLNDFFHEIVNNKKNWKKVQNIERGLKEKYPDIYGIPMVDLLTVIGIGYLFGDQLNEEAQDFQNFLREIFFSIEVIDPNQLENIKQYIRVFDIEMMKEYAEGLKKLNPDITLFGPWGFQ